MTIIQQQFIELLKSGLWGTPANPKLFAGNVDWKSILRTASEQTMQVIVADGIETLPKECWPPKEALMKLMMIRLKTEQMHQVLNSTLNQIVNALTAENIPSALLKGQGVAQNYLKPRSRMCGDIDLYVGEKNYMRACEIIAAMHPGGKDGEESDHHMHLQVNGVEVEVHKKADQMPSKKDDRKLQAWNQQCIDELFGTDSLPTWDNNKTVINLPSETFDSFFILHHAVRHMTTEGVGFRQICDWAMYLHKHHTEIDVETLHRRLKEFHMEAVWNEFGLMVINVLGLTASEVPLFTSSTASRKTAKLLKHIFISGNFGRFDANSRDYSKTSYIKRKWRSFRYQSMRLCKLILLFPKYATIYLWQWLTSAIIKFMTRKDL